MINQSLVLVLVIGFSLFGFIASWLAGPTPVARYGRLRQQTTMTRTIHHCPHSPTATAMMPQSILSSYFSKPLPTHSLFPRRGWSSSYSFQANNLALRSTNHHIDDPIEGNNHDYDEYDDEDSPEYDLSLLDDASIEDDEEDEEESEEKDASDEDSKRKQKSSRSLPPPQPTQPPQLRKLIPYETKDELLYLMECMTTPSPSEDPDNCNPIKFEARERLLDSLTFEQLQYFLTYEAKLGYIASSSKEELMIQYLLYCYDPTIQYYDL